MNILPIVASVYLGVGLGLIIWIRFIEKLPPANWWKYPGIILAWPVVLLASWIVVRRGRKL